MLFIDCQLLIFGIYGIGTERAGSRLPTRSVKASNKWGAGEQCPVKAYHSLLPRFCRQGQEAAYWGGREFFSKCMDGSRHDDMLIEKRLPRLFYLHRDLYAIAFQYFPPLHPKKVKKYLLAICQIVYLCAKYFFRYLRSNRNTWGKKYDFTREKIIECCARKWDRGRRSTL